MNATPFRQTISGPVILTNSGRYFRLTEPEKEDYSIEEIAQALSKICRFTGHCSDFYSVAQHSVYVSRIVPQEYAMAALLHDAAEAFIGDVSQPLKELLPGLKAIEKPIEAAILKYFGLPPYLPPCVHDADKVMLATEKRDLLASDEEWEYLNGVTPVQWKIRPENSLTAERLFITRYHEIKGRKKQ